MHILFYAIEYSGSSKEDIVWLLYLQCWSQDRDPMWAKQQQKNTTQKIKRWATRPIHNKLGELMCLRKARNSYKTPVVLFPERSYRW